jgi:hypothetical protein
MSRAETVAKRSRHPTEVRLAALLQEIRDIARGSEMPKGTRNRLHAIADGIERLTGSDFLFMGYCGLVLRGYSNEREIPDPILRKVWRLGKRIAVAHEPARKATESQK